MKLFMKKTLFIATLAFCTAIMQASQTPKPTHLDNAIGAGAYEAIKNYPSEVNKLTKEEWMPY